MYVRKNKDSNFFKSPRSRLTYFYVGQCSRKNLDGEAATSHGGKDGAHMGPTWGPVFSPAAKSWFQFRLSGTKQVKKKTQ